MISPPPYSMEKGGAGGYAPSPNTASVSGVGGDTPDYIFPPHQAKGNIGSPLEGSRIQVLHCGGLAVENSHPPGVLRPHPGGPGLATPTRPPAALPAWPVEELRMARPARAWQSPVALGLEAWEDFVGKGGGERVLHPANVLVSLESPAHGAANWLSGTAGRRSPVGLCGTLLPGD